MIIFDLDDTLIDTSGSVTPHKLRDVIDAMKIPSPERAYRELLSLNEGAKSSKEALILFSARYQVPWEEALKAMSSPLPFDFKIPLTLGAKEILTYLVDSHHTMALVTGGDPFFQMEKLEKSGIDPSIFSNIAIPEDSNKKPYYQALAKAFSFPPGEILVCGDRSAMDLLPAHELGFRTFLRRWGRGLKGAKETWMEGEIVNLLELKERGL